MVVDPQRFSGTEADIQDLLARQKKLRAEAEHSRQRYSESHPVPKPGKGELFVRGPVPLTWLNRALSLGDKAGHLSWALWWLVGIRKGNPVRLTRRILDEFCLSPRAAARLLAEFEHAGLVEVDRKRGRSPIVTLVLPGRDDDGRPDEVKV